MVVDCSVGRAIHTASPGPLATWLECHQSSLPCSNDPLLLNTIGPLNPGPMSPAAGSLSQLRFQDSFSHARPIDDEIGSKANHVPAISNLDRLSNMPSPASQTPKNKPQSSPSSTAHSTSNSVSISRLDPAVKFSPASASSLLDPVPSPAPSLLFAPDHAPQVSEPSHKRHRPLSDVDGTDTADMSVKKRRLRLHLITSRLSRPFSLPATHILNREAIAGGPGDGKRFVKLTAYLSARRAAASAAQHSTTNHNPSSVDLLRRAAILNRLRVRVMFNMMISRIHDYGSAARVFEGGQEVISAAVVANHGMQLVNAARYFFPSPTTSPPPPPQHQHTGSVAGAQWHRHHTPNHVHAAPGPAPMSQHYGALLPRAPPPPTEPINAIPSQQTQHVEYHHARLPPSPKIKPRANARQRLGPSPLSRSPDLRPAREREFTEDDEVDNDSAAFPGSELDSRYADSSDEDETDGGRDEGFDINSLFCGGPRSTDDLTPDELDDLEGFGMLDDEPEERDEHFYEEYLDELDGIPRGSASRI